MRVLVTGHEGYVGSVLTPLLTAAGHDVVGLDAGFFSQTSLGPPAPAVPSLRLDVRDATTEHVRGFDAVIHLAGLSNDPLGDLDAATTLEINYEATVRLATLAKRAGVERFLFASSCSLYGAALPDDVLDESADFRPVTPYGRSKMLAERDLQPLADERFTPVYLRAATVYGYSPRLRADLVLNNLVGHAVLQGAVLLKSDGTPWRPLVHVADLAQAYLALLTAPRQVVCNRAFNVGRSAENYQMLDVARIVAEQLPGVRVSFADGAGPDVRCYRVSCERLQSECPEYRPSWNAALGAVELAAAYRRYDLTMTQFNGPAFQRLQRIKELQQSNVLDTRLRPKRCNGHATKTVTWSSATTCRACGGGDLEQVIRFAKLPLADVLLNDDGRADDEPLVPATVVRCLCCQLVQLSETVSRHALFNADYPYFSSASAGWVEHNRRNAEELIAQRNLNGNAVVIEAACNDGYMLRHFAARGIRTLGVDPAAGPVATARALGLDVREAFFDEALARRLRDEGAAADLFLANNVLAHVDDLPGFVRGIAAILRPQGQAVIEVPYLGNLIEQGEFDTIYHQHLCYFSVTALQSLFAAAGLRLAEIRRLPTHGGSLRLYVDRTSGDQSSANAWMEAERNRGMHTAAYYAAFRDRVENTCRTLREKMSELRRQGLRIAAYGAAAKGTTLLAAAEIPAEWIEYVVDRNPHKHGRYLPGVRRPIVGLEVLQRQPPDVLLLLPWNLADEILEQQADFRRRGGRFLIPVPDVRLV